MAKESKSFLIDMDGVLVQGSKIIPGAEVFISKLIEQKRKFLLLTNNPIFTPRDLAHRLNIIGLQIPEDKIFTSAMATAFFLQKQRPNAKVYVIGESGLTSVLHDAGFTITDHEPDYVVLGETLSYNFEVIKIAIRLIIAGARFIATNPDPSGPSTDGIVPACGAMAALIETVTGVKPFFIGKPNALMMRLALNYINAHSESSIMVGDRMETDMVAGITSGMETILVLSGVTTPEAFSRFPYIPTWVVNSVKDIDLNLVG